MYSKTINLIETERRMVVTRDSEWELGSDKILVKSIHFQCYKASSIDTW